MIKLRNASVHYRLDIFARGSKTTTDFVAMTVKNGTPEESLPEYLKQKFSTSDSPVKIANCFSEKVIQKEIVLKYFTEDGSTMHNLTSFKDVGYFIIFDKQQGKLNEDEATGELVKTVSQVTLFPTLVMEESVVFKKGKTPDDEGIGYISKIELRKSFGLEYILLYDALDIPMVKIRNVAALIECEDGDVKKMYPEEILVEDAKRVACAILGIEFVEPVVAPVVAPTPVAVPVEETLRFEDTPTFASTPEAPAVPALHADGTPRKGPAPASFRCTQVCDDCAYMCWSCGCCRQQPCSCP